MPGRVGVWHRVSSQVYFLVNLFIPRHTIVAGYYGFTLVVRVSIRPSICRTSVHPSIFRFWMITWVNINGFSPNLVCALMLWRSGLGLLIGKFRQIFTELSAWDHLYFRFRTITWVNNKGFSTKLLYALTLRRSGLGLQMGKFLQFFTELSAQDTPIFSFPDDKLSK